MSLLTENNTLSEHAQTLVTKWESVIANDGGPAIEGDYKKAAIAQMLESQSISNGQTLINEDTPTNVTGGVAKWDPVLISMVRRSAPSLIAFDVAGVQPMSGPSGLVFAMRSKYENQNGTEALFKEANSAFSGRGIQSDGTFAGVKVATMNSTTTVDVPDATDLGVGMIVVGDGVADGTTITGIAGNTLTLSAATTFTGTKNLAFAASWGYGLETSVGEGDIIPEMAISIEKIRVDAETRALKARYSHELAQDMRAIHRLDAEAELINVLNNELLSEQNREFLRRLYAQAKIGSVGATMPGQYDLVLDADGRWSAERFKGLHYQIEKEANRINIETRRGKGNFLIASADVVSALAMAKVMDMNRLETSVNTNWNGNLYVGNIGQMKVYIDPYAPSDFFVVGYKGESAWDAGFFFCPYTQYVMHRATDPKSLQPIMAFKTRAGYVSNPFFNGGPRTNAYYRISAVKGI